MKKILVVLLVLAVAGGVFAQGEWSVGGNVRLGAKIDFIVDETLTEQSAQNDTYADRDGRQVPFFSGDGNQAELDLNYKNGGFTGGLAFRHNSSITAKMGFVGDRYELGAEGKLNTLIGQALLGIFNNTDPLPDTYAYLGELARGEGAIYNHGLVAWGNYLFLDGLVKMTVGVNKDYEPEWKSNNAFRVNSIVGKFDTQGDYYASINARSGLVTELNLPGINLGVMLRSLTLDKYQPFFWNASHTLKDAGGNTIDLNGPNNAGQATNKLDFMEDVLKKMIFGMKFDLQPIDIAAQFNVERLGAYLGLNWAFTDVIKAGLSFMGEFQDPDPETEYIYAAFGASVGYDTGIFGLTLKAGYGYNGAVADDDSEDTGGIFVVAPEVYYKVIPDHLYAKLATKFEFGYDGFGWEFNPGVFWNFKGDGATDDPGTGIVLTYKVAKPYERNAEGELKTLAEGVNEAFVGFRWNF